MRLNICWALQSYNTNSSHIYTKSITLFHHFCLFKNSYVVWWLDIQWLWGSAVKLRVTAAFPEGLYFNFFITISWEILSYKIFLASCIFIFKILYCRKNQTYMKPLKWQHDSLVILVVLACLGASKLFSLYLVISFPEPCSILCIMIDLLMTKLPGGGGFSHWHGIRICACLLGRFFAKYGIAIAGVFIRAEGAQIK